MRWSLNRDIIEQLRDKSEYQNAAPGFCIMFDAANEIERLRAEVARSSERMAEATERGDRYHEENNELFKRAVEAERVGAAAQLDAKLMAENWTEADERAAAVEVRLAEAIKVIKPFALLCDLEVKADQGELDSVYPMVAVGRLRAARAFLDAVSGSTEGGNG